MKLHKKLSIFFGSVMLFGLFFLFPTVASAATYCDGNPEGNCYVDSSVGTSGDGKTPAAAFKTIQEAADVVGPGDVVNVKGGMEYSETVTPANSGLSGDYITYQAWSGTGIPVINAQGLTDGFYINSKTYIVVSDFLIKNATSANIHINSVYTSGYVIVKNNICIDGQLMGIYNQNSSDNKFYNNVIFNNSVAGFHSDGGALVTGLDIKNNIIVNNNTLGALGGLSVSLGVVAVSDYNIVWNNNGVDYANVTPGVNDLSVDPLFIDSDSDDFRLQTSSMARDNGTTLAEVTGDILGIGRPQGTNYDIGAYEYYEISVTLPPDTPVTYDTTTPTFTSTASTISTGSIVSVQYSIDGGAWETNGVSATDGAFDETSEKFTCYLDTPSSGLHTFEIRSYNSQRVYIPQEQYLSGSFIFSTDSSKLPQTGQPTLLLVALLAVTLGIVQIPLRNKSLKGGR